MTKAEKAVVIEELTEKFNNSEFFYITDSSTLTVEKVNELRGLLFEQGIEMKVVKNTLARKALEAASREGTTYEGLYDSLKGPTALLFTEVANAPARVLKDFRKANDKPVLKAAYIDSALYIGDDKIDSLSQLKSKEELIGDVIALLQSPMKNVLSALNSGGQTVSGLLKALEEREAA